MSKFFVCFFAFAAASVAQAEPWYSWNNLPQPSGVSVTPTDINDYNHVVGRVSDGQGIVWWNEGGYNSFDLLPEPAVKVIGNSAVITASQTGGHVYFRNGGSRALPFRPTGAAGDWIVGIDSEEHVVVAPLWQQGEFYPTKPNGDRLRSMFASINSKGHVAGSGFDDFAFSGEYCYLAGWPLDKPMNVNERGTIAGSFYHTLWPVIVVAGLWNLEGDLVKDLGTYSDLNTVPLGQSDSGIIVGQAYGPTEEVAVVWFSGGDELYRLEDILSTPYGSFTEAADVNNHGWIVGTNTGTFGDSFAFVAAPLPEPQGLVFLFALVKLAGRRK